MYIQCCNIKATAITAKLRSTIPALAFLLIPVRLKSDGMWFFIGTKGLLTRMRGEHP
jgi:hypothetical protein